jgi:hypothetical protein
MHATSDKQGIRSAAIARRLNRALSKGTEWLIEITASTNGNA